MKTLNGKTIAVGVCGGIAAYKTCTLVSRLRQAGADVHVMMTENATQFVSPLTFETLSQNRVTVDTFDRSFAWEVGHVSLAKRTDAVIIAPATANVIAKLAHGIADDFLTTTVLACTCGIILAPAMNTAMLDDRATQDNIGMLVGRGMTAVYGEEGHLACGDSGRGRMAEPEALFDAVCSLVGRDADYAGKTVLVTAGATRTDIDPVRFISNRSSGKMGYAIAAAAYARGAKIIFIKGATDNFDIPREWNTVPVTTTEELFEAVKAHAESADTIIMAAAPCDYVTTRSDSKIKSDTLTLELKKAPDCAAWVGEHKGGRKLVIFAAETDDALANGAAKLRKKRADMAIVNDVTAPGAGFDVDTNIVTFVTEKEKESKPLMTKAALADIILDKILRL